MAAGSAVAEGWRWRNDFCHMGRSNPPELTQQFSDWQPVPDHVRYREQIKKAHGHKLGFWSLVK